MSRRCPCGAQRKVDGCPHGCDAFRKPAARVRAAGRGARPLVERLLSAEESSRGAAIAGTPFIYQSSIFGRGRPRTR